MKRFFAKAKRKNSPKPPHQHNSPAKPANIAAVPPDPRAELDVIPDGGRILSYEGPEADRTDPMVPPDEGGREGSQVLVQVGMDAVRELHRSGASTSGVVTGGSGRGNQPESEWFRSPRWAQHSRGHVFLFPLAECPGNTGGETETSTGMWRCIVAIGSHLPCTSCEGVSRGDIAWGHEKRYRNFRLSQSRPKEHPYILCQSHGSPTIISTSRLFSDHLPQETAVVENKVANLLPRIASLGERFDTRPGSVAEQRRRDDLIRYVTIPPLFSILNSS